MALTFEFSGTAPAADLGDMDPWRGPAFVDLGDMDPWRGPALFDLGDMDPWRGPSISDTDGFA